MRCSQQNVVLLLVSGLSIVSCGDSQSAGSTQLADGTGRQAELVPIETIQSPRDTGLAAEILAADDPLFVAMGLPDDPDEVAQILSGRHERLVDECMVGRGIDAYVPESGENADGHLNAAVMNTLSTEARRAWVTAWRGSGDGGDLGCVDQFNELVYPLAAFPELGPYLDSILDDQRFIDASQRYATCVAQIVPVSSEVPDVPATGDCRAPLEEVRHTVYREKVIAFLEVYFEEVAKFGRDGALL